MKRLSSLLCSWLVSLLLLACAPPWPGTPSGAPPNAQPPEPADLTSYVNPFVGTAAGGPDYGLTNAYGDTFPGAASPFGMVQWSPDTTPSTYGGYNYSASTITGLSLTHLSGAGCLLYQDIPFLPYVGPVRSSPATHAGDYVSRFSHRDEEASPGYYRVKLATSHVQAELTVTPRTGFGQFTYPPSTAATMLINTSGSVHPNWTSQVQIERDQRLVTGFATGGNFCFVKNGSYTLYFAAQFDRPFTDLGTWHGSSVTAHALSSSGPQAGAYVVFDTRQTAVVHVKVGISFVSVANALANVRAENPSWDFPRVRAEARQQWNRLLLRVQVRGGTLAQTQTFYTNLYHALLFPSLFSDGNGDYLGFDQRVHRLPAGHAQYANYSGWDIYHSQISLLALLSPDRTSDMMQSLVNDYKESGCLPKWPFANVQTNVQDGDSADPILASAYAFGARRFDTATALKAMLKGATRPCRTSAGYVERPGLEAYQAKGYLPIATPALIRGVASATLEYSTDDFALAQFARALGDLHDATVFSSRAHNWHSLFNPRTGFIQPRRANGTFPATFDPTSDIGFEEGDASQYTWMIPYDLAAVVRAMGGNERVASRLANLFTHLNAGPRSSYAFLANEPGLSTPWTYDFIGQPSQTQAVVRRTLTELYNATPSGLSGNDDLGTMGAWYVWSAIGLFPLYPGRAELVLGSPLFPQITLTLGNGKRLQIRGLGASERACYVQSLSVNGAAWTRLWLPSTILAQGANLVFQLQESPTTSWGTKGTDAPPSFGSGSG